MSCQLVPMFMIGVSPLLSPALGFAPRASRELDGADLFRLNGGRDRRHPGGLGVRQELVGLVP